VRRLDARFVVKVGRAQACFDTNCGVDLDKMLCEQARPKAGNDNTCRSGYRSLVPHRPGADPPSDETGYFDVPASMYQLVSP